MDYDKLVERFGEWNVGDMEHANITKLIIGELKRLNTEIEELKHGMAKRKTKTGSV